MKVEIGDTLYEVVTLKYIAKNSNRTVSGLRKMMEHKVLPEANFRTPDSVGEKKIVPGYRLYTLELANKVAEILRTFRQGIAITEEQKQALRDAFAEERAKLNM